MTFTTPSCFIAVVANSKLLLVARYIVQELKAKGFCSVTLRCSVCENIDFETDFALYSLILIEKDLWPPVMLRISYADLKAA